MNDSVQTFRRRFVPPFTPNLFGNLQLFAGAIGPRPPIVDDPDVIYCAGVCTRPAVANKWAVVIAADECARAGSATLTMTGEQSVFRKD